MTNDIDYLPDYTALEKLASALWQQTNSYHGAAIMVGAGFSRSAASTGDATRKLPLWNDFAKKISTELKSDNTDPLRLAEEYCAYFGRQALNDLIKKEINDAAWIPGDLHNSLLKLPWSEILTTNWDTLLERTSTEVYQPIYTVVSRQEHLSSSKSPRIIKLHGTIGAAEDFIFTQEDYRKYPQKYAAFVNFSRQVFIENELCLLGFSGDDPNFLQWAGWVRDNLKAHSRRIYLVGALGLSPAKRKYLESINVAPIDLNDLVKNYDDHDIRHLEATKIFIKTLENLRPKRAWEWRPTRLHSPSPPDPPPPLDPNFSHEAKLLEKNLPLLEQDRQSYPEWLICPYEQRSQLQHQITDPSPTHNNLAAMTEASKDRLLYEISWHHQVTFNAIPPWLANDLLDVCDPDKPSALSQKQQLEIAALLLENTRWMDPPESQNISQKTKVILEKNQNLWPESSDLLAYHNAMVARDAFDYSALEKCVEKISSSTPVWKLRKASLLAELGQFDKGKALVAEAHKQLLIQNRTDRNSIYVLSRLAWADWLMRWIAPSPTLELLPPHYQENKCDPWDHIEHIRERIYKELDQQKEQQSIEPLFEPGRYIDHSNTRTISYEPPSLLLLEGFSRCIGIPLKCDKVSFLGEQAGKLTELNTLDSRHRFALAIRSADNDKSPVLNTVFSRVQIACLSEDDVDFLLNQCMQAIGYWSKKNADSSHFPIHSLRIFVEVLARVSVRASPERAKDIFLLAMSLGKKPDTLNVFLFDALQNLIDNSIKSIPKSNQNEILLEALDFPLPQKNHLKNHWQKVPNPIIYFPGDRKENTELTHRIAEIIDAIAPCSDLSWPPLLRLLPLLEQNFLNDQEREKIGEKIWGPNPSYERLPDTGLLPDVLLKLPAPNPAEAQRAVNKYLFERQKDELLNPFILEGISNVALTNGCGKLSREHAQVYFEKLTSWRKREDHTDILRIKEQEDRRLQQLIGKSLAYAIVPALPHNSLEENNFNKLLAFHSEVDAPYTIIALSHFAAHNSNFADHVEKLIRQDLQGHVRNKAAPAAFALLKWREIKASPATVRLTSRLIYLVGSTLSEDMPALIWTTWQLYIKGFLSEDDTESLIESIPWLFDSTNYKSIPHYSREAIHISLTRSRCIQLAEAILKKNKNNKDELRRIIEKSKQDPLPEVRFALENNN